jgi:hypothetical protein
MGCAIFFVAFDYRAGSSSPLGAGPTMSCRRRHPRRSESRTSSPRTTTMHILWLVSSLIWIQSSSLALQPKIYRYFGFGSNVLPSTMKALRGIEPINATAAVLPDYELRFDGPGGRTAEPSAAFVQKSVGSTVHGVLYALTDEDFAKVGRTEGVPFGYRWERCFAYEYVGNGIDAGSIAIQEGCPVETFTLVPPKRIEKDIPPSSSYLGLIQEGSRCFGFDKEYQQFLNQIPTADNLLIKEGFSGLLLQAAEKLTKTDRSYMLPP